MFKARFKKLADGDVRVTLVAQYPYQAPMYLGQIDMEDATPSVLREGILSLVETNQAQVQGLYTKWEADGDFA